MGEVMEAIEKRRSVRRYLEKEIPHDVLTGILEAVRWSPSWANTQCWEIVVVKDPAIKAQLQETLAPKNPATRAIVNAPVVIALCGRLGRSGFYKGQTTTKFGDWFMYDLGLANQTLCMAAHDAGLGTVIVGLFDHDRAGEILNAPAGCQVVTLIPMGYPDQAPPAPKRNALSEFVHYDRF